MKGTTTARRLITRQSLIVVNKQGRNELITRSKSDRVEVETMQREMRQTSARGCLSGHKECQLVGRRYGNSLDECGIVQTPEHHSLPALCPLVALRRSASSTASNFCCSICLSRAGSCDLLTWSLSVCSDFGRLAFCRSSSQEDRVAMVRACSARISSQRLLRWGGCVGLGV